LYDAFDGNIDPTSWKKIELKCLPKDTNPEKLKESDRWRGICLKEISNKTTSPLSLSTTNSAQYEEADARTPYSQDENNIGAGKLFESQRKADHLTKACVGQ